MKVAKFRGVAIAAGLLLAISGPSFAAKQMSDTKRKPQSRATESRGLAVRQNAYPYPYGRDDPYAPGVNWPGKW